MIPSYIVEYPKKTKQTKGYTVKHPFYCYTEIFYVYTRKIYIYT